MFRLLVLLALAATAYGYRRIVGGEEADIENYNYQVSVGVGYDYYRCSGSLIKSNVVVTAAFCVYDIYHDMRWFIIRAGSNRATKGGEEQSVKAIHHHSRYNYPKSIDYDIAILILNGEFTLSEKIGTIDLVGRGFPINAGTPAEVTGWGALKMGGPLNPQSLQVLSVPNIDRNECINSYQNNTVRITDRMSCWGYPEAGKDTCQSDNGGPLVIKNEEGTRQLVGVAIWYYRLGCAIEGRPGIYTDLTNEEIHDFITNIANVA